MAQVRIRPIEPPDRPAVETLLDETIGRGFWSRSSDLDDIIVLVAVESGRVVGVASAQVEVRAGRELHGHLRLVAVDAAFRHRGVATRLVSEVSRLCEARGAQELVAYAWVHGGGGTAPLSGALERAGFVFERRIEGFYGSPIAESCPACGLSPCICPADVYRRRGVEASDHE